jgi:hypothetical protein
MANEPAAKQPAADYQAHLRNYSGFVQMFKYGAIGALLIALFVVWLIS